MKKGKKGVEIKVQINQTHIVLIYHFTFDTIYLLNKKQVTDSEKNALLSFNQAIVLTNMFFNTQQKTKVFTKL